MLEVASSIIEQITQAKYLQFSEIAFVSDASGSQ